MKKVYIQPAVDTLLATTEMMICGSQEVKSNKDIDYGGIDEEGEKDPASRRYKKQWDDEEEDDDY